MDFNNFREKYLQAFIKGIRKKQSKEVCSQWPRSDSFRAGQCHTSWCLLFKSPWLYFLYLEEGLEFLDDRSIHVQFSKRM